MQFNRGLEQQEQAAGDQDQVPAGQAETAERDQGRGQRDQPRHDRQQPQPHQQGQRQADQAGAVALLGWQAVGEDGDEHQVVDAEDDLEHDQRGQAQPDRRIHQPFHDSLPVR